jgi:uncharacterized protein
MINYRIEAGLLTNYIPPGVELDFHGGETFITLVAFRFLDTRILDLAIPRHRDFEEVGLRFYVKRRSADTWRRDVCFIRKIVPRQAIATVARVFYGEPCLALPMKSAIVHRNGHIQADYSWRRGKRWESLSISATGDPASSVMGSREQFIREHYWGYARVRAGCSEYRVEHPRWRIWPASSSALNADVAALCGEEFAAPLAEPPVSQFIAEGSDIRVWRKSDDPILAEAMAAHLK